MQELQTFLQMFRKGTFVRKNRIIYFKFQTGASFNPDTGFFEKNHSGCMVDFRFYKVTAGDRLECLSREYQYNLATYSEGVEDRLIYTYCYQEEESWTKYRNDFTEDGWRNADFYFQENGWVRIAVRRADKAPAEEEDKSKCEIAFRLISQEEPYQEKEYYKQEIKLTADTVKHKCDRDSLVFGLMTDSHYVINGGWEDSVANLRAVHKKVHFDAMIHLGDLTDGMVPLDITKEYAEVVMKDLNSLSVPVYLTLGNHDSNYFRKNPEWMTREEQSQYYLNRDNPWYYVDFAAQKLRCLFLYSFDHNETIRYGFPMEETEWVRMILKETPDDFSVLVFAHVPLLPAMHFWSDQIRNSDKMLKILEEYVEHGGTILAYVHGHNHADQVFSGKKFPIVSVGCAKCEDFKDKKPEGSVTYDRELGTVSQELWDVMIVNTAEGKLDFVRFGAGEDRTVQVR